MDGVDDNTEVLFSTLTDPTEEYLEAALKDGFVPHKDDLFLVHGPGGAGKSSLIAMFLGEQRDLTRVSTAVAEESLHLSPVRDVSTKTFTDKWELVDIDRQARMVAHTSRHLLSRNADDGKDKQERERSPSPHSDRENPSIQDEDEEEEGSTNHSNAFLDVQKSKKGISFLTSISKKLSGMFAKSLTSSLGDDPDNVEGIFAEIQEGLHDLMREPKEMLDFLVSYSVRVLDSGGQPQFHEVVSIILPAVTGIVSVFKLSECLDARGEVVFYKNGVESNDPYTSYLTNEQVIRHDLLAIQSGSSKSDIVDATPNLAFVGTFLDQQHKCPEETPDQKDVKLHSMITEILPEELQECVISNGGSLRQVTFRLNTRTPSEEDYKTAGRLKDALTRRSRVKPRNLPLKWCGYEVALRKLMEKLGRQTLSLQECQFVGYKLGFDAPSLKACLHYLRQYHIISFHDVLPNVIFGSSQVILDKITELIIYSLRLKRGDRAVLGVERKFHQQGILCLEILQSEACSMHYRSNFFIPEDLLKVLKSLLIVTEVGEGEYLMPCVLEVSNIYPSPPPPEGTVRSSFVLHFSKKSPMIGIYCCTISYLLTEAGWKLLKEGGEVVQVARNSVTFELPQSLPGKLTFLDPLSSYLEVVVEFPNFIAAKHQTSLYRKIRDTFFTALKQAMQTLNYEVRTPELSFLCPEQSFRCSILPHLATVDDSQTFLICSVKSGSIAQCLAPDQSMWLCQQKRAVPEPPITSECMCVVQGVTIMYAMHKVR